MKDDKKCLALAFALTLVPAGRPQTPQAIPRDVKGSRTSDIQKRDIEGLTPEQKAATIKAADGLTPEQKAATIKAADGLTPEQKAAAIKAAEGLTPEQRDALLNRAAEELKKPVPPRVQHIVEGPGIPKGRVFLATDLIGETGIQLIGNDKALFEAAQKLIVNIVVIKRSTIDQFSDKGVGNGLLISRTLILTARHVAERVAEAPHSYELLQVKSNGNRIVTPLTFVATRSITGDASGDPDLALIKVRSSSKTNPTSNDSTRISFHDSAPKLKDPIAVLGSSEMGVLPAMGTGIVTTAPGVRELGGTKPLRRTSFGSSVLSFPGLSGAPVFTANGKIIGVVLGGVKEYVGTGEKVMRVPEGTNWEHFPDWSWATPLAPFLAQVRKHVREDR